MKYEPNRSERAGQIFGMVIVGIGALVILLLAVRLIGWLWPW